MKNKVLYFDVETTGRNAWKNDITQIAGIIEVDGEVVHEFNIKCQPRNWETIDDQALEVTGVSRQQLRTFPTADEAFSELELIIAGKNNPWAVDRYDKNDKFTPAGYNVGFDLDFLQQFFKKSGETYGIGWFINWKSIDGLAISRFLEYSGQLTSIQDHKLGTLCDHFNIHIDAHDALSDIRATRELLLKFKSIFKGANSRPHYNRGGYVPNRRGK